MRRGVRLWEDLERDRGHSCAPPGRHLEPASAPPVTTAAEVNVNGVAAHKAARPAEPFPRRTGFHTFSSLAYVGYCYLWVGTLFMSLGQWIQQVTLGYV